MKNLIEVFIWKFDPTNPKSFQNIPWQIHAIASILSAVIVSVAFWYIVS